MINQFREFHFLRIVHVENKLTAAFSLGHRSNKKYSQSEVFTEISIRQCLCHLQCRIY